MNSVHEDKLLGLRPDTLIIDDPFFDYAIDVSDTIKDIGFKDGDKMSVKQLHYIGNCIITGKEVTKEDVLNIK